MTARLSLPVILGLAITLVLFYIMQYLIASDTAVITENNIEKIVDFVRVKKEPELITVDPTLQKPEPPVPPPTDVPPSTFKPQGVGNGYGIGEKILVEVPTINGNRYAMSDGEYLPVVKVQPVYPRRAMSRGLSGWVIVEFTVTDHGMVSNPRVIQNCAWIRAPGSEDDCHDSPNSIFDRAALKAAEKFKYKPKVVNGEPIATAGVRNMITFQLVEE
ncbi:MAG: energy transducer TonB [Pseudomonadales bacterium]|nr:energy transducer TonB [Pseudomonadales bacterium]